MPLPLFDTKTPLEPLRGELDAKIAAVLDGGRVHPRPRGRRLRGASSPPTSARGHAVGVANGTDAITIALRALGVGPGDDVVVPSFTFYASAEAIVNAGARPVFCDVDPETLCVTADTVRAALTPRHARGARRAPVRQRRAGRGDRGARRAGRRGRRAVGRLARADAGRPGSLGTLATFSFFPSKNLPCFGDGGAVTTNDPELDERLRMLRFHGSRDKSTFELVGHNSRLDELQAGILRVLLPAPRRVVRRPPRRRGAAYERAGLGELVGAAAATEGSRPAWHLYVVRDSSPDALAAR